MKGTEWLWWALLGLASAFALCLGVIVGASL